MAEFDHEQMELTELDRAQIVSELMDTSKLFIWGGTFEVPLLKRHGVDLPGFASFQVLFDDRNESLVKNLVSKFLKLSTAYDAGVILYTFTLRTVKNALEPIPNFSDRDLPEIVRKSSEFIDRLRKTFPNDCRRLYSG